MHRLAIFRLALCVCPLCMCVQRKSNNRVHHVLFIVWVRADVRLRFLPRIKYMKNNTDSDLERFAFIVYSKCSSKMGMFTAASHSRPSKAVIVDLKLSHEPLRYRDETMNGLFFGQFTSIEKRRAFLLLGNNFLLVGRSRASLSGQVSNQCNAIRVATRDIHIVKHNTPWLSTVLVADTSHLQQLATVRFNDEFSL